MLKSLLIAIPLLAIPTLAGCTTQQAYGAAQAWQRNQCNQIPDKAQFDRCMNKTDTSYESYKQQRESERK